MSSPIDGTSPRPLPQADYSLRAEIGRLVFMVEKVALKAFSILSALGALALCGAIIVGAVSGKLLLLAAACWQLSKIAGPYANRMHDWSDPNEAKALESLAEKMKFSELLEHFHIEDLSKVIALPSLQLLASDYLSQRTPDEVALKTLDKLVQIEAITEKNRAEFLRKK